MSDIKSDIKSLIHNLALHAKWPKGHSLSGPDPTMLVCHHTIGRGEFYTCFNTPLVIWYKLFVPNSVSDPHYIGYCEEHKNERPDSDDFVEDVTFERVSDNEAAVFMVMY